MCESTVSPSYQSTSSLKTLLVAYDFYEASQVALRWAMDLAKMLKARVVILYVESPSEMADEIECGVTGKRSNANHQELLDALNERLQGGGLEILSRHRVGIVADILIEEAAAQHADLVLMGAYGSQRLDPPRLGSTVEAMIRDISCSVLVIGPEAVSTTGSMCAVRRIAYLKADDKTAAHPHWIEKLAETMHASIEIDYVVGPGGPSDRWRHQRLESQCEDLAQNYRADHLLTTWHLLYGGPASIASTVANVGRDGLLVLDSELINQHLPGGTGLASLAIQNAPCPVVLISKHHLSAEQTIQSADTVLCAAH